MPACPGSGVLSLRAKRGNLLLSGATCGVGSACLALSGGDEFFIAEDEACHPIVGVVKHFLNK
jgi:hypothetical protein